MKKLLCIALCLLLMLSLWACSEGNPEPQTSAPTTEATQAPTVPTFSEVDNPVKYFSLSMGEDYEHILRMDVFYNEDGTVHVEYVGKEKKVGNFDANIMHGITEAFLACGLSELSGKDVYGEGEANASMYVEFTDGTMAAVGFSGEIPEAFAEGFGKMDQFFESLTKALPVYVPQPMVMGEVDEVLLKPMMDILNNSELEYLDSFTVSQIPKDDLFSFSAGLSSREGIAGAVSCAPMMMTEAYSMVIVKLEEGADADAVCKDFEGNLDWRKWVCVAPDKALIAVKEDMVLCLMAVEQVYDATLAGISHNGWTQVTTLERP